jgi:pimeloyl-ACP methyl ester carboxylesterase
MDGFSRDGLLFDVSDGGVPGGRPVVLLHGFPADRRCWDEVTPHLHQRGWRTLAPDQRGYSPAARPAGRRPYLLAELAADVLALADAAGADRFDLVGHDWGAVVGWVLAASSPHRIRTLTALSVPHPRAIVASLATSTQALHSWYIAAFNVPRLPEALLAAGNGAVMAAALRRTGLPAPAARRYAARATERGAMTGPLNWYRALPLEAGNPLPPCPVPTLYVWSDGDTAVTRRAAEGCAGHVTGPYRFEVMAGVSHWIPEAEPEATARFVAAHLDAHG